MNDTKARAIAFVLLGMALACDADAAGGASAASFKGPMSIAADGAGNLYVADTYNNTIRKIAPPGVVTTLAGVAGNVGYFDGAGAAASFDLPYGAATDRAGNIYVADTWNNIVRKITPAGVVKTLAGGAPEIGHADGMGAAARFRGPSGVAADGKGNIYVADTANNAIRKITPAGLVTTLAGAPGVSGHADGTGAAARFVHPRAVATDRAGNVYVADIHDNTIRKITPAGAVSTLAGAAGQTGYADGAGAAARFHFPSGIAADGAGNVYVADTANNVIRKISRKGVVTTLAGSPGQIGHADGMGAAASFFGPHGVATDKAGNVYVADTGNSTVRKITPAGMVKTLAGAPRVEGHADSGGH